ncbi:glycosyltransferase family 2 protein [Salisaeta longa]|uniref:glycosyltransferase family 2 protein n=1 Tax=Salisaeta longa TaxID=503170 RepID=UPI00146B5123|nr:glycosyltransferase [Salisaeta longa]
MSVIIPTYQRPDDLARCLDQLVPGAQTLPFDQYEVIVTDDEGEGSETEQLVKENYDWARWVPAPGQGPAANRNNGARYAKGEWLVFTDDDCIPDAKWLAAFAHHMEAPANTILEGKTIANGPKPGPGWEAPLNLKGGKLWSCNFAIPRKAFDKVGGFDELYPSAAVEDVDFRKRVLMSGGDLWFVESALVVHPWRRMGTLLSQLKKVVSWRRYYEKYPEELCLFNRNYFIGAVSALLKEAARFVIGKSNKKEVFSKAASLFKSFIILKIKCSNVR